MRLSTAINKFLACALAVPCLLLSAGCHRIPLHEARSGVYLRLDFHEGPATRVSPLKSLNEKEEYDFNYKWYGHVPEQLRVCFYDAVTHRFVTEDFVGREGGFISVPAGDYDVIVYGTGMDVTRVAAMDTRAGGYAYTSGVGSRLRISKVTVNGSDEVHGDYRVIYEPDHIYVGRREGVHVPVQDRQQDFIVYDVYVESLLDTYTFEVYNIINADRIQTADVYITGQAPLRYMWDLRYPTEACAILFSANVDRENGTIRTVFNTFGKLPNLQSLVFLNVLVTDQSGAKYQWIYNVTDQFDNPDNTEHRIIVDDYVEIPDQTTGGFSPDVHDWEAEIEHVPLS